MQALEMESLVGNERKTLSRNKDRNDGNLFAVATKKDFMTKVMIMAGIAIFSLTYLASSDNEEGINKNEVKVTNAPVGSAPVVQSIPSPTEKPVSVPETNESEGSTEAVMAGKKLYEDGEYIYSKFGKVNPLIDHPLPDEETKARYEEQFKHWHFWDGDEDIRPNNDYMAAYPNRDIPNDDFDDDAWQVDAVFVNHYLNDASEMITRAQEAIYTEYGRGKPLEQDQMIERIKMLRWTKIDLAKDSLPAKYARRGDRGDGGWTTERSQKGLIRRLLHAMMTSDTFTVVMGGHSAAAGQG